MPVGPAFTVMADAPTPRLVEPTVWAVAVALLPVTVSAPPASVSGAADARMLAAGAPAAEKSRTSEPPVTAVPPACVLAAVRVSVPAPVLVSEPAPERAPASVPEPRERATPVESALVRLNVVPATEVRRDQLAVVTPDPKASDPALRATAPVPAAAVFPKVTVPALTVRPPARALVPLRTRLPAPALVSEPAPRTLPPRVKVPAVLRVRSPVTKTLPVPRLRPLAEVP